MLKRPATVLTVLLLPSIASAAPPLILACRGTLNSYDGNGAFRGSRDVDRSLIIDMEAKTSVSPKATWVSVDASTITLLDESSPPKMTLIKIDRITGMYYETVLEGPDKPSTSVHAFCRPGRQQF